MKPTRILSLDGGGIRGYLTVLLLEQLVNERPTLMDEVHLFAGTSVGSIIALALASGHSPSEVRVLFEKEGKNIFPNSLLPGKRDIGWACMAKYDNKNLKRILSNFFHDQKLGDIDKRVLIASFDLCRPGKGQQPEEIWDAKFFHNYTEIPSDRDEKIVDVILRSSAAPFYFPSYEGYVDGFVTANNPSTCALAQVLKVRNLSLNEISMLSVGTGINPNYIRDENEDRGWAKWLIRFEPSHFRFNVLPLIYMMWEGSTGLANYQCEQFLHDRFHRIDLALPKVVDIDAVKSMKLLKDVAFSEKAFELISETADWPNSDYWLDCTHGQTVTSNGNQLRGEAQLN